MSCEMFSHQCSRCTAAVRHFYDNTSRCLLSVSQDNKASGVSFRGSKHMFYSPPSVVTFILIHCSLSLFCLVSLASICVPKCLVWLWCSLEKNLAKTSSVRKNQKFVWSIMPEYRVNTVYMLHQFVLPCTLLVPVLLLIATRNSKSQKHTKEEGTEQEGHHFPLITASGSQWNLRNQKQSYTTRGSHQTKNKFVVLLWLDVTAQPNSHQMCMRSGTTVLCELIKEFTPNSLI